MNLRLAEPKLSRNPLLFLFYYAIAIVVLPELLR